MVLNFSLVYNHSKTKEVPLEAEEYWNHVADSLLNNLVDQTI